MANSNDWHTPSPQLTLPFGAAPGQARIVIGPGLPPPLDTFTWAEPFGPLNIKHYVAGIIFYGDGDDTTYDFLCSVAQTNTPTGARIIHIGQVLSGAVIIETATGVPKVLSIDLQTAGPTINHLLNPHVFRAEAMDALGNPNRVGVSVGNFGVLVQTPGGTAGINADTTVTLNTLNAGGTVNFQIAGGSLVQLVNGLLHINPKIDWGGSTTVSAAENTSQSTGSTTYVALGTTVGVVFTAPPSGKVSIDYASTIHGSAAATFGLATPQVRIGNVIGSGTIVYAASDNDALEVTGTVDDRYGAQIPVTGLTPGTVYNAEMLHRTNGTGTFQRRRITIRPDL